VNSEIVKRDFDFGWKTRANKDIAELALRYNRGDILDVGCGTCQLSIYLRNRGWKGKYIGVDAQKYADYNYPSDIQLIIGDASSVELPQTDTCVLYSVLEHADDPLSIVSRCLKVLKKTF
jgi:SAM-dependent methyltransferase